MENWLYLGIDIDYRYNLWYRAPPSLLPLPFKNVFGLPNLITISRVSWLLEITDSKVGMDSMRRDFLRFFKLITVACMVHML